ncbi:OmpA family protein [Mycobacterium sp. M1]|uniref:OmpA family protein n=1 Tax=Mycolicibacter acidiphilus TaxID=2835306 RepID=A0ABS5RDF0_9MYCO|nr:OmpA family protein [Mycolicibacter acidiphilus]
MIGQGMTDRSELDAHGSDLSVPSLTVPSASVPARPGLSFAPLSILRNGHVVTLNGDLPDIASRTALLDMLQGVFGGGVSLVDNLNIKAGVATPDIASLMSVFKAAASISDFKFKINGDAVTLLGSDAAAADRAAVEAAARAAWPNLKLSNEIQTPTATAQTPGPSAPSPTGDCANLQSDINALMSAPVTFVTNGHTLTPSAQQQLSRVAEKLNGCHSGHVAVSGYTDNTGNDAVNVPLSANRAKSVADFLVAHGVPAGSVTSNGFGSADPVASNATPDGRAQNRRVVITVN